MFDQATDYMRGLDATPREDSGMRFMVRQMPPKPRENPDIDFSKLLVMLGAAVLAGIAYDHLRHTWEEKEYARLGGE